MIAIDLIIMIMIGRYCLKQIPMYLMFQCMGNVGSIILVVGKLLIPSYEQTRELNIFYILCKQEQITVLNQTPTVSIYQFIDIAINIDSIIQKFNFN